MKRFSVFCFAMILSFSAYSKNFVLLDGRTLSSSDLAGKWVFIHYWANWCHACKADMPFWNAYAEKHKNEAIVLGRHFDPLSQRNLNQSVRAFHLHFPQLLSDPQPSFGYALPSFLPATIIISPKGKIVATVLGAQSERTIDKLWLKR